MQKETSVCIFSSFFLFFISDNILEVFIFDPRHNETNHTFADVPARNELFCLPQLPKASLDLWLIYRIITRGTSRDIPMSLDRKMFEESENKKKMFNNFYLCCHRNVRNRWNECGSLLCLPFREFFRQTLLLPETPKMPLHQPSLYVYL